MPPDEPAWWYGPPDDPRTRLLEPLARVYGALSRRRAARAPTCRAPMPVICIGNFTAGGTGKTPLALLVAALLIDRGRKPAFLTRGYGGRRKGPAFVEPSIDTAREAGDEPMLLARAAPTMVSTDRASGARAIAARMPPLDAIVMDDGLQNPALHKDLRIAVVDGRRGVGNGCVIPAGPLRAPLEFQLAQVDAIVVNQPGAEPQAAPPLEAMKDPAAWLRDRFSGPVLEARAAPHGDIAWIGRGPLVAFAGIAHPQRFYDLLRRLGGAVVDTVSFPDHHAFSEDDARRLLTRAAASGAGLVTTEKDHVRLIGGTGARAELLAASRPLAIRLALEARDGVRLAALIDGVLK